MVVRILFFNAKIGHMFLGIRRSVRETKSVLEASVPMVESRNRCLMRMEFKHEVKMEIIRAGAMKDGYDNQFPENGAISEKFRIVSYDGGKVECERNEIKYSYSALWH